MVRSVYGVNVFLSRPAQITETQGTSSVATSATCTRPQIVAVIRSDVDLQVMAAAAFSSDRTAVRVTMRVDLVVPNPKAIVRISGSCRSPHDSPRR